MHCPIIFVESTSETRHVYTYSLNVYTYIHIYDLLHCPIIIAEGTCKTRHYCRVPTFCYVAKRLGDQRKGGGREGEGRGEGGGREGGEQTDRGSEDLCVSLCVCAHKTDTDTDTDTDTHTCAPSTRDDHAPPEITTGRAKIKIRMTCVWYIFKAEL